MGEFSSTFQEQSYVGPKAFRPKPEVFFQADPFRLIVATSWGDRDLAGRVVEMMREHLDAPVGEMTTIGSAHSSVSESIGKLTAGVFLANELLLREFNANEFSQTVELLALTLDGSTMSWIQIGQPQLILKHQGEIHPLAYEMDLAAQFGQRAPLPRMALGLHKVAPSHSGVIRLAGPTEIFAISRSELPASIFSSKSTTSFAELASQLSQSQPEIPFWLGLVKLGEF